MSPVSARVHPTALVDPAATLGADVVVGPFCVIGPRVVIGDGSVLHSHVVVDGDTTIGARARIFPFASVGHAPQDLKYRGEASRLVVGDDVTIRENATLNPGTEGGGLLTSVGNRCAILAGAHVAHDCRVGDGVILVNNAMLAGHCVIGDHAIIGGGSGLHQFVRVGAHAFVGGLSGVENDVIPYGSVIGNRAHLGGLNIVGLKRRGFDREQIHTLRRAYRMLFANEGTLMERVEDVAAEFADAPHVLEIVDFIRAGTDRAVCMPRNGREA